MKNRFDQSVSVADACGTHFMAGIYQLKKLLNNIDAIGNSNYFCLINLSKLNSRLNKKSQLSTLIQMEPMGIQTTLVHIIVKPSGSLTKLSNISFAQRTSSLCVCMQKSRWLQARHVHSSPVPSPILTYLHTLKSIKAREQKIS